MYQQNYGTPQYNAQQTAAPQTDGALGWGDSISQENQFPLLPAGDYYFTIKKFERGNFEGSEKISPCPKAIITFDVSALDGSSATLTENYLLHTKMEWKLSEFFAAIGMKEKGQPAVMQWSNDLIGKSGVCKVIVNRYKDKKTGEDKENNRIDKLYPSYDQPRVAPAGELPPYAAGAAANGTMPQYSGQQQNAPMTTPPQYGAPPQQNGWQRGGF